MRRPVTVTYCFFYYSHLHVFQQLWAKQYPIYSGACIMFSNVSINLGGIKTEQPH